MALLEVVHRAPEAFGYRQTRWTLTRLRQTCDWLRLETDAGMGQVLKRLGIVYKRGRQYLHSPDPNYDAKLAYLLTCYEQVVCQPERYVFLYLDEFSFYRQPSVANAYELRGDYQPLAQQSYRSNTRCRAMGALNALTGQVTYRQAHKITVAIQIAFYHQIAADYPDAQTIFVAQDNWPNHAHPKVLAPLQTQRSPFWPNTFANWSTEERFTQPLNPY